MPRRLLEIRTYMLKPGTRDAFDALLRSGPLPMLARFGIDVVAYGPSLHHADGYGLMRSYASLAERTAVLETFYGSAEWIENHDAAVMALIASYETLVVEADSTVIDGLRRG